MVDAGLALARINDAVTLNKLPHDCEIMLLLHSAQTWLTHTQREQVVLPGGAWMAESKGVDEEGLRWATQPHEAAAFPRVLATFPCSTVEPVLPTCVRGRPDAG